MRLNEKCVYSVGYCTAILHSFNQNFTGFQRVDGGKLLLTLNDNREIPLMGG